MLDLVENSQQSIKLNIEYNKPKDDNVNDVSFIEKDLQKFSIGNNDHGHSDEWHADDEEVDDDTLNEDVESFLGETLSKIRLNRSLRRTVSECNEKCTSLKGILKNRRGFANRSISESGHDQLIKLVESSIFISDFEQECENDENKLKKTVRFSEKVCKTLFNSTSSIDVNKKKNKKRALRRKKDKLKDLKPCNKSSSEMDKTKETGSKSFVEKTSPRSRQDSGYDSEEQASLNTKRLSSNTEQVDS